VWRLQTKPKTSDLSVLTTRLVMKFGLRHPRKKERKDRESARSIYMLSASTYQFLHSTSTVFLIIGTRFEVSGQQTPITGNYYIIQVS